MPGRWHSGTSGGSVDTRSYAHLQVSKSRSPSADGKSSVKKMEFGIEAAAVRGGFDPPQTDDLLGFVVATTDASQCLEVVAAFDILNDALIEEIVCKLLLVSDVEEPERVTILNDEKRVIDDHEVADLSPDELLAYLRTLPGAGEVDFRAVLGQSARPESQRAKHAAEGESL